MRVLPASVIKMVDEIWGSREILREEEPDEQMIEFLEDEVSQLCGAVEVPFSTDAEEAKVYQKLRTVACAIEAAIYELLAEGTFRDRFEQWRWGFYDDILELVRELSRVGDKYEEGEEDDPSMAADSAIKDIKTVQHSAATVVSPPHKHDESPCDVPRGDVE